MITFACIMLVVLAYIGLIHNNKLKNIHNEINTKDILSKIENDYLEALLNTINSYRKILHELFDDRHDSVITAIISTMQTMYENKDFETKTLNELNDSSIDIILGILEFGKIDISDSELAYIRTIVSSYNKFFKLNPVLAARATAVA